MARISCGFAFWMLGVASLLPWNCLLSCINYMELTSFPGSKWAVVLSPLFNATTVTLQLAILLVQNFLHIAPIPLMLVSCVIGAVSAAVILLVLKPSATMDAQLRYDTALTAAGGLAVSTGLLQSATGSLASKLMSRHGLLMGFWSNGVAAAGILSTAVAVPLSLLVNAGFSTSSLFILTSLTYCVSILVLLELRRIDQTPSEAESHEQECKRMSASEIELETNSSNGAQPSRSSAAEFGEPSATTLTSLRRGSGHLFNIFLIYVQTFLAFPAVTSKWKLQSGWVSSESSAAANEFYGLAGISIFQIFDLVGRVISEFPRFARLCQSSRRLWTLIMLRWALLLPCFAGWIDGETRLGNPISHALTMALFAATNGMLTNLAFARASIEALPQDSKTLGSAMPLGLVIGIVIGSNLSAAIVLALEKDMMTH
eukprot:TRINITY_DN35168_c0_g1_i1.p1 TRINITY_DN35168_c0_g1~~TRINITY_DN35168_c0_g1_i1.p1  ORF type:complete len:441 (+),score=55.51 TRINITY_DN35168_c0_g1_i1:39-1325(+)